MAYFTENTVEQLVLPGNSCLLNYSVLNTYFSPKPFRSFSIKYVVEGMELYAINGNKYQVKNREYILANAHSEGFVEVDSKKAVSGICIDVAPDMLSEVVAGFMKPDSPVADISLDRFFNSPDFLENKYSATTTQLGSCLLELERRLEADPLYDLQMDREFYYILAEKIVQDHIPVIKKLQSVKAVKSATRKDLLRKVEKAKEYISLFYDRSLSIGQVAMEAGLSEYHFFRLFKSVYGLSPHQYILQKRLWSARNLIVREGVGISIAACMTGFPDIQSLSKAYKKYFGCAPSGDRLSKK